MFDRITFDPAVMGGRACIRGMRMTVSLVVNLVANGMSTEDIVREYPQLEAEDIRQALQYASALANEEIGFFKSPPREISGRHGRGDHNCASVACSRPRRGASPRRRSNSASRSRYRRQSRPEHRVLLTVALDFGDILAVARIEAPSVIIFRLRNQTPAAVNRGYFA
jgi:uncharacterized protein (DUF433 family)